MSAILGNPMVATAALPLLLGIVLGLFERVAALRLAVIAALLWGAVVLFLHWDTVGLSAFPPVSASQKLIYLALLGVLVGLLLPRLLEGGAAPGLAVAAVLFAFVWLGWNRLLSGGVDFKLAVATLVAVLIAAGMAALLRRRGETAHAEAPFLAPAAVLTMGIAGAIISVTGASIVVGQLLGSLAALAGGWCLVTYVGLLVGRPVESGWTRGVAFLVVYATAGALIQTALLAPKANPVALVLAPLPLLGAALVAGPARHLLPGNVRLRPLLAGFVIAIPAILAVLTAIVWAPEGAALSF